MITISGWFKTTASGANRIWSCRIGGYEPNGFFMLVNDGTLQARAPDENNHPTLATGMNDGNWHHVAMTWEPSVANGKRFYVDGVLVRDVTSSVHNGYRNEYGLYIGAHPNNNGIPHSYFNGEIKGVKVLNEVLTPIEVETEYNTTAPT